MTYLILRYVHLLGLTLMGAGLIGVWYADLRSRQVPDLPVFGEAVRQVAVFYDGLVVPGALLLLSSGTWLTITVYGGWAFLGQPWLAGMVALFAFEFIEGNTITRLYFLRLRRLTTVALEEGSVTRELERARQEHLPTFAHFLDLPILFVIVALGAMRPNTWTLFLVGTALVVAAATVLALAIPRIYPLALRVPDRNVRMAAARELRIEGLVSEGFEPVREAFVENFTRRGELGGACCIYQDGEKVVDLWGGVRDRASGEPWRADTMVVVHSATKGLAAMVMALVHSRRWLDYDERVCAYWPEFAQAGKERITVRQLLAHQAGLFAFDEPVDSEVVADLDRLAEVMARQRPAWEPGERQAYHAISLGFYEGELLRRIDPGHRSLGRFFAEEIATPLSIDFYLRLPESIPDARLAPLEPASRWRAMRSMPLPVVLASMNRRSVLYRSLIANPGTAFYIDPDRVYARNLEAASGLGVGTARAIAKAYGVFASGGRELGLRAETIEALMAPAIQSRHGFYDECFRGPVKFSLGFMKPSQTFRFGHPGAFGAPGAGGAMGYADPEIGIGYGYVTNRMGTDLRGDPRDVALRSAISTNFRRPR